MIFAALSIVLATNFVFQKYPPYCDGNIRVDSVQTNVDVVTANLTAFDGTTWKFKYWDVPSYVTISPSAFAHSSEVSSKVIGTRIIKGVFSNYDEPQEDEPPVYGSSIHLKTKASPVAGGTTDPTYKRWYGFYPMEVTRRVSATPNAGWKFDRWVLDGHTHTYTNSFIFNESLPQGTARVVKTYDFEAQFSEIPIEVTVYLDNEIVGTKMAKYTDLDCGDFDIDVEVPVNHHFFKTTGSDTIGNYYTLWDSKTKMRVNLTGYIPPYPKGYVNCNLISQVLPDYPWRDDPDGGDGDSGSTPNINNALGWVWVHARPIPSNGSKGTVSPTDWAIHGTLNSTKTFTFVATPLNNTKEFVQWEDSQGNVLSKSATYSPQYKILHTNGKGYEVTIYARFKDKPPEKRKVKIAYMPRKIDPDTYEDICGLGGITVEGTTSYNTSLSIGDIIYKTAVAEYREDYDEETEEYIYTFTEDPVTIPLGVATPSNGFKTVWWKCDNAYEWQVVSTSNQVSLTIPAQTIVDYGWPDESSVEDMDTFMTLSCVFEPKLGVRLFKDYFPSMTSLGFEMSSDPEFQNSNTSIYDLERDGKISVNVRAKKTSGQNEIGYAYYSVYDNYLNSSTPNIMIYADCKGPTIDMEINMTNAVRQLEAGDYRIPWHIQFIPYFSTRSQLNVPFFNADGNIIHDESGVIIGDFDKPSN